MHVLYGLLDGQVLQRSRNQTANASVRGECSTGGVVRATIRHSALGIRHSLKGWTNRKVGAATTRRRSVLGPQSSVLSFIASLSGIPVGGPYDITLSVGNDSVTVQRIWVGDVWLLAGQSNMQGCGNLEAAPKPHPMVHAMYMNDHWDVAREPIHFLPDSPDRAHWLAYTPQPPTKRQRNVLFRQSVKGVSPALCFGREMVKRSGGVPQGLLACAHGGTSMEQWDPVRKKLGGDSMYGSMLRTWRKTGQPVAGMLWYQGESDCTEQAAPLYVERMKKFVAAVRRDLNQPDLPFLLAQIGKVFGTNWDSRWWNSVQDQQIHLKKRILNLDVATTIDLPLDDMIHVGAEGQARLGARLARLADRMVYRNRREPSGPELVSVAPDLSEKTRKAGKYRFRVKFRNVVGGLRSAGVPAGFAFVDSNQNDLKIVYKTELRGSEVLLETPMGQGLQDLMLKYGHGTSPYANITDARDMAIPVFGPVPIGRRMAVTPFFQQWFVSSIQPARRPFAKLTAPKPSARLQLKEQLFQQPFIDLHGAWEGRSGRTFFFSKLLLSEPMKLNLRVGYDGPIKVWIDDRAVFCDPNGTNPAVADQRIQRVNIARGAHRLSLAMDLNQGRAWGFFLRFERRCVSQARIADGKFAMPVCSA